MFSAFVARAQKRSFSVIEATIPDMQRAMKEKRVTSREIVQQYLARARALFTEFGELKKRIAALEQTKQA